jgi:membrane dipeptidase
MFAWPGVRLFAAVSIVLGMVASDHSAHTQTKDEPALVARARAIHDRVITLDTHNDIDPAYFTPACNYTMRLTTQVNLPKMKEGGLDVSFMIRLGGSGTADAGRLRPRAYRDAVAKFDAVHSSDRADRAERDRSRVDAGRSAHHCQVGPQGCGHRHRERVPHRPGHQASEGVPRPRRPLHVGRSQRPQPARGTNTGEQNNQWLYGGLSPLGKQAILEMNKWGGMVDVSHLSKGSTM